MPAGRGGGWYAPSPLQRQSTPPEEIKELRTTRLTFFRFFPAAPILRVARPWCSADTVADEAARGCNKRPRAPVTTKPLLHEARFKTPTTIHTAYNRAHPMSLPPQAPSCKLQLPSSPDDESSWGGHMTPIPGGSDEAPNRRGYVDERDGFMRTKICRRTFRWRQGGGGDTRALACIRSVQIS